jgi:hypothetical protein
MGKLIGLCGYAQTGKDTAAANMPGFTRMAFADELKADLYPLLNKIGCRLDNPAHKRMVRDLLVAWGRTARMFETDHWINRLLLKIPTNTNVVITDVRYPNEVRAIESWGGAVVRIQRLGSGPANDEERVSIEEIDCLWPKLVYVTNDVTPEQLGKRVLEAVKL